MIFLRRRHSDKQVGDLCCQNTLVVGNRKITCKSTRLKFVESQGPIDTYRCKDCGCTLRYHTIPMGEVDAPTIQGRTGLHPKELNAIAGFNDKVGKWRLKQHKVA